MNESPQNTTQPQDNSTPSTIQEKHSSTKIFNIIVTIVVMLTGAGFGALVGGMYTEGVYWWLGLVVGAVSSLLLANLYLWQLSMSFDKLHSKIVTWFWGTFIAIISGAICTTVVHVVMALTVYQSNPFAFSEIPSMWLLVVVIGQIIGVGSGLFIGAIASLVFVLKIKGRQSEAA